MADTQRTTHIIQRPSDRIDPASELPESTNAQARQHARAGDEALFDNRLQEARLAYEQALGIDPQDVRTCHNMGVVAYRENQWQTAQDLFAKCIEAEPHRADFRYQWGLCALKLQQVNDAEQAFRQAIDCDAQNLSARFQLALLLAREAAPSFADRKQAIEQLEAIVQACHPGVDFAHLEQVCFLLGSLLDDFSENNRRAIAVYRRGLTVNPLFAPGHNNLGVLLMKSEQIIPALGAFKIAIQLEPDYMLPYGNLARLLFYYMSPTQMETEFANITEEFGIKAPSILSRISLELINLGRAQVYESLYTHGHRIKNLMGLSGSRLRRVTRAIPPHVPQVEDLRDISREQEQIYNQWVAYLRSMKQDTLNPTLVDVSQLIQKATQTLIPRAGDKTLTFAAESHVPQIKADAGMLHEAVTNLVINAIDAVPSNGQISVQVGADQDRNSVFIEVEDNGPGIPEELQTHIFDPGYSTREQGNGYGLSICSRIATAHRGTLRVISQPGAGAVFRIDLPVDFEVSSEEDSIGLQRSLPDASRDPIAEEFIP